MEQMNSAYLLQLRRSLEIFRVARTKVPMTCDDWNRSQWRMPLRGACDLLAGPRGLTDELRLLVPPEQHADLIVHQTRPGDVHRQLPLRVI